MIYNDPCDNSIFENVKFSWTQVDNPEPYSICTIMRDASPAFFSAPSLGLVKKGTQERFPLPTCPTLHSAIPDWATLERFYQKLVNREIVEWKPGEWESQRPLVTSIVNQIAQRLGFKGFVNVSLEDEESCANLGEWRQAFASRSKSAITACKPFYHDLIGLNGLYEQETAKGVIGHEIGHLDLSLAWRLPRYEEIKADLYTLRNAAIGRACRDATVNLSKRLPFEMDIAMGLNDVFRHPYIYERIRYLTEGLCALYPEQNRDIC